MKLKLVICVLFVASGSFNSQNSFANDGSVLGDHEIQCEIDSESGEKKSQKADHRGMLLFEDEVNVVFSGRSEVLKYRLHWDPTQSWASLFVASERGTYSRGVSLRTGLRRGETIDWHLSDGYGGPEPKVTCKRGGRPSRPPRIGQLECRLSETRARGETGEIEIQHAGRNRIRRRSGPDSMVWNVNYEYLGSTQRDTVTLSPSFQDSRNKVAFLLGENSEHLVDTFTVPMGRMRPIHIQKGAPWQNSRFTCSVR